MQKRMESLDEFKKVQELIETYKDIAIFHHVKPDGDCLGSSFGLQEILKTNYPTKNIMVIGDADGQFPWLDLKFTSESDVDMTKTLAIVVDVSGSDRVVKFDVVKQAKDIVRIDHHPNTSDYATTTVLLTDRPATCQIVAELAIRANWEVNKQAATYLYLGLLTDSNRFLFRSVTDKTYDIGAFLTRQGADRDFVHANLYKRTLNEVAYVSTVCSNWKFDDSNKVLYYYVSKELQDKLNLTPDQCASPNMLAGIEGVHAWVLFTQYPDHIRTEFRCIPGYKINEVAFKFNGGGHDQASGCKLQKKDEIEKVIKEVLKMVN